MATPLSTRVKEEFLPREINDLRKELKDDDQACMVGLWAYNPPQCLSALKDEKDRKLAERFKIDGLLFRPIGDADSTAYIHKLQPDVEFFR